MSLEDAIHQGLVPPVRCYRIESNIDLSEVRFNGREFVKNDLQTTLLVPSRDELIAKLLNRYFDMEGLTTKRVLSSPMFVAQVHGKSMEPGIPDGAYCLFTFEVGGTRNGRIVLAQKAGISDQEDTGASYTVKAYHSTKTVDPDAGWKHERITLRPSNPNYRDIIIPPNESDDFRIVAFFINVLTIDDEEFA